MYAIVEIAGQQFKVEQGKKIFVHRLEDKKDAEVRFDNVLLLEEDGKIAIGEPTIKDAFVDGKIIDDTIRGEKVIVFKKKRKKGYRVRNGHRQNFTQVEILSINGKSLPKKEAPKKAAKVAEDEVAEEHPVKKAPAKKASDKAVAAKKPAAKKPAKSKE